jgi:hypothetical protein
MSPRRSEDVKPLLPGKRQTLMVSIWQETGESGEDAWRARVEDVRTGGITYLPDAAELPDFFEKTMQLIERSSGPS